MTPTHIDSPIRRNNAVGSAPIGPQRATRVVENDDEAERRASRVRASITNDNSIIQHKEGLDNCLKIFNDNKISKDNVWQMSLIDHFRALIDKHHKTLSSFQIVGSSLEASSKIYGIRVDSVHADILRMSSGLIRQKIVDNPDESKAQDTNDTVNAEQSNADEEQRPARKKKRANRIVSTVTKNKDSINAKLETTTETEAIFAKLNSTVENNNSAKKLLQYVLSSYESELLLRMNYKIWKSEEAPINDVDVADICDGSIVELPEINWNPSLNDVLRPQITGYVISNTPAEDDGNEQMDNPIDKTNDQSYIDVQFDIDANVEPIQNDPGFLEIDMGEDDFDSLAEDDQNAIQACRGLKRPKIIINDMRPDNASLDLEYSYRTLTDKFNRFWAGPSYWKFKIPRENTVRNSVGDKKKKAFKNKIEPTSFEEDTNETMYISINSRPAAKLKKANIYNRWDARKTKLPRDFKLDRNRFLRYPLATGLSLPITLNSSPQTVESDQDINEIGNNVAYDNNMTFHNDDDDNLSSVDNFQNIECTSANITEIETQFLGAPEQVNQINVKFAKTAKVVDMKQLKQCCLNIITKDCAETAHKVDIPKNNKILNEKYVDGISSFYQIYKELPQKLTKNMKEALSPAVAFYSILHLANDNNFRLIKDDENGFLIRQIL